MEIMVMGKKKIAILWDCHESASGGGGVGGDHIWLTRWLPPLKISKERRTHTYSVRCGHMRFDPVFVAVMQPVRCAVCRFLLTPAAVAASLRPIACPTVWLNGREGEPWSHPAPISAIQRCGRGTPLSRYHAISSSSLRSNMWRSAFITLFAQPDAAAFWARGAWSVRMVMMSSHGSPSALTCFWSPCFSLVSDPLAATRRGHLFSFCSWRRASTSLGSLTGTAGGAGERSRGHRLVWHWEVRVRK